MPVSLLAQTLTLLQIIPRLRSLKRHIGLQKFFLWLTFLYEIDLLLINDMKTLILSNDANKPLINVVVI